MSTKRKYDPNRFSEPILRLDEASPDGTSDENDEHNAPDERFFKPKDQRSEVLDSDLDKAEQKRLKWNAYMRRYNERKRQERKERLSKVEIHFKNSTKLYDVNEVNKLINNFVQINERIYNDHIECFDPSLTNEINSSKDDLIQYCDLLQNAIISILEA